MASIREIATAESHAQPSSNNCALCFDPLLIPNPSDEGPAMIIDDVELRCSHHFHWSCFTEYDADGNDRTLCPECGETTLQRGGQLLVIVRNEGGVTAGFDLGAALDEEKFYDDNPALRREMAFLNMISMSELEAAQELLEEGVDVDCRDSETGGTALHLAVVNGDEEGIMMLLGYGASREVRDSSGRTPADVAREMGAEAAWRFLQQQ
ncbi:ankyrin [Saitoella complicata NRRL Y-17804]|uniref:RING-type domain-containing protein n=1 Tax=Saitoella complicata (strain BCRC 22490 / CBS 7301 / JCM 7358 / NBRC 10748 / NRRL Y-17804) TaxID=698492 RepID=A0A0E9NPT1_SAICN|nr:ankyrin [Saitoella complicata NRRL Y-17804]ODQ52276.1 ankyrin [Saitoella complicata NRRL Y-17804]GAO51420.1 hypothetical protein G7K_5521-t1 [Saitoella complicata NRRL Y-17804]